jgi:hypothetical protein
MHHRYSPESADSRHAGQQTWRGREGDYQIRPRGQSGAPGDGDQRLELPNEATLLALMMAAIDGAIGEQMNRMPALVQEFSEFAEEARSGRLIRRSILIYEQDPHCKFDRASRGRMQSVAFPEQLQTNAVGLPGSFC